MFIDVLENLCKANNTTVTAVCKELGISTSKPTSWRNGSTPNSKFVVMFARESCRRLSFRIVMFHFKKKVCGDVKMFAEHFNVTTDFLLEMEHHDKESTKMKMLSLIMSLPEDKVEALYQIAVQALDL